MAGVSTTPSGILDTRQLAKAVWHMSNYRLGTVAEELDVNAGRPHRALDDSRRCRKIFNRVVTELGGWSKLRISDMEKLHTRLPEWPANPTDELPNRLYDALANGGEVRIQYINGEEQSSNRRIRPVACFNVGERTYLKAHCQLAGEVRTFRLDRLKVF